MDHGLVKPEKLGWLAWLFGPRARRIIVREADVEAARQGLPPNAHLLAVDPNGNYIVYESRTGLQVMRFRASAAWLANEPTIIGNNSPARIAAILPDGRVLVVEGLHRTRAMARDRVMLSTRLGGVEQAPGWLDFAHDPEGGIQSSSSIEFSGPWKPVPAK